VREHARGWPGPLTLRTIRDRREGHVVVVDRDGVRVAEGDDEGAIRATSGLVLAEAPLAAEDDVPSWSAPPAPLWSGPRSDATDGRATAAGPFGSRSDLAGDGAHPGLVVDVFGERRGEVRVCAAYESWRRRALEADLLVDGRVVARLRTLGPWAEEAVVIAGGGEELARLARFDHLRGVVRTVSAWDLAVEEIPDERLRALTVAAVLRLAKLRAAAAEPAEPRRGAVRWLRANRLSA
jgi:hypothetical protein